MEYNSSTTLLNLLSCISSELDHTWPSFLISNIVSSFVTNRSSTLLIALALSLRSKENITTGYKFGFSASYHEFRRLKMSAALDASKKMSNTNIADASRGLIQSIIDNYDSKVFSPNGLINNHLLAQMMIQYNSETKVIFSLWHFQDWKEMNAVG